MSVADGFFELLVDVADIETGCQEHRKDSEHDQARDYQHPRRLAGVSNVRNGWKGDTERGTSSLMALVLLHNFSTSMEAAMARSRLRAEGIEAYLFDVEGSWDTTSHVTLPVRMLIAEEDVNRATAILAHALRGGFAVEDGD